MATNSHRRICWPEGTAAWPTDQWWPCVCKRVLLVVYAEPSWLLGLRNIAHLICSNKPTVHVLGKGVTNKILEHPWNSPQLHVDPFYCHLKRSSLSCVDHCLLWFITYIANNWWVFSSEIRMWLELSSTWNARLPLAVNCAWNKAKPIDLSCFRELSVWKIEGKTQEAQGRTEYLRPKLLALRKFGANWLFWGQHFPFTCHSFCHF